MAVTEIWGKKFLQIDLGSTGGDYTMSKEVRLRELRVTNLGSSDYMVFHEYVNSSLKPKICKLDATNAATFFTGEVPTRLGFTWTECSVDDPATAIVSVEFE